MTEEKNFPHITISGGPDAQSLRITRDGRLLTSIVEWQVTGGSDSPVVATFREIVTFDGAVDVFPERKTGVGTH